MVKCSRVRSHWKVLPALRIITANVHYLQWFAYDSALESGRMTERKRGNTKSGRSNQSLGAFYTSRASSAAPTSRPHFLGLSRLQSSRDKADLDLPWTFNRPIVLPNRASCLRPTCFKSEISHAPQTLEYPGASAKA